MRLPIKLLQHILACLPDPPSHVHAVQASPALYHSFKKNEKHIVAAVLTNCMGTGALREAQLTRDCAPPVLSTELAIGPPYLDEELQDTLDMYIAGFLHNWPDASDFMRTSWALSDALTLWKYHTEVILPLKDMFIQAASDPESCTMSAELRKGLEVRPVSNVEEERICRALYRFGLFRRLFRLFSWRREALLDFTTIFFLKFAPWEIAQLGCIHDFLGENILPVFNDVASHDIVWGMGETVFDASVTDCTIQHLLTLGLKEILAIARLQDAPYTARVKALSPTDETPQENEDFMSVALMAITYTGSIPAKYSTLSSVPPFHPDLDPGPETTWRLSIPQDGSYLGLYEQHDWTSRRWGYVLWDHARLQGLCNGCVRSPELPKQT